MPESPFSTATQIGIMSATRRPRWAGESDPSGYLTYPDSPTAGVALSQAPAALVYVSMRDQVHRRRATLAIPTPVIGDVFTVTIDSSPVVYPSAAATSLDEMVVGLAAAINGDPTAAAVVLATAVKVADDTVVVGTRDGVQLDGLGIAAFSVDFARAGTSVITAVADPEDGTAIVFWLMDGAAAGFPAPKAWVARDEFQLTHRGFVDRYPCGGAARVHVAVLGLAGHADDGASVLLRPPNVRIGPGAEESV